MTNEELLALRLKENPAPVFDALTEAQKNAADKAYRKKIKYYTGLIKAGEDGPTAWNKANEKYGHPLEIYEDGV